MQFEQEFFDTIKQEVYKVERCNVSMSISKDSLKFYKEDAPMYADDILFRMEKYLLMHEKELAIDVPLTWWDHWKQDNAPAWLVERYPVKYRTIRHKAREIFPQAKYKLKPDDLGRGYVTFHRIEPLRKFL